MVQNAIAARFGFNSLILSQMGAKKQPRCPPSHLRRKGNWLACFALARPFLREMTGTCLKFARDLLHRFALLVPSPFSTGSLLTLLATPSTSTSTSALPAGPPQAPLEPSLRHRVLAVRGFVHPDRAVLPTLPTVVQQFACCQLIGPVATLDLGKLKFDPTGHHV